MVKLRVFPKFQPRTIMAIKVAIQFRNALQITIFIYWATCEGVDINVDCANELHLTSDNYPQNYPDREYKEWLIIAPSDLRILITFNDFSSKEQKDFLELVDVADIRNTMEYTGENKQFPPFLTRGNELLVTFTFRGLGTRRGFNISVSCHTNSDNSAGHLVGGTSPSDGYLSIPTISGEYARICENSLSGRVAEVVCGELGYPGVKEVLYDTEGCQMDEVRKQCTRAPSCEDRAYRFEDCTTTNETCTSSSAVKIKCFEPGYKGCYSIKRLQNGSPFQSTSQCVSLCNRESRHDIAVIYGDECFCSTADEVNLSTLTPDEDDTCSQRVNPTEQVLFAIVYNVSVGFCDPLEITNGFIHSDIAWFGTIVHLTCDDGYSLNGSETLQCVPGASPYHPIWNGDIPTCDYIDATVHTRLTTTFTAEGHTETTPTASSTDDGVTSGKWVKYVSISAGFLSLVVFGVVYVCYHYCSCTKSRKREKEEDRNTCKWIRSTWKRIEQYLNQLGIKRQPLPTRDNP